MARLSGGQFVPFTLAQQRALVQAFREVMLPNQGPVELISYKWVHRLTLLLSAWKVAADFVFMSY